MLYIGAPGALGSLVRLGETRVPTPPLPLGQGPDEGQPRHASSIQKLTQPVQ